MLYDPPLIRAIQEKKRARALRAAGIAVGRMGLPAWIYAEAEKSGGLRVPGYASQEVEILIDPTSPATADPIPQGISVPGSPVSTFSYERARVVPGDDLSGVLDWIQGKGSGIVDLYMEYRGRKKEQDAAIEAQRLALQAQIERERRAAEASIKWGGFGGLTKWAPAALAGIALFAVVTRRTVKPRRRRRR